jgi:hypothetical protein
VGYSVGYGGKDAAGCLYRTVDGVSWEQVADDLFPEGKGNETALAFGPDDVAYCLLREGPEGEACLGTARPPYEEWAWRGLGVARGGGPEMIRLADGRLLAAVRLYDGGLPPPVQTADALRSGRGSTRTSLCWVDPERAEMTEFLVLPSGGIGGSSYAGLVEHEGRIWASYYSGHEDPDGGVSIYLARFPVPQLGRKD